MKVCEFPWMRPLAVVCALAGGLNAYAADTGELPCRTTEECQKQAARIGVGKAGPVSGDLHTSAWDQMEDQFYWLNKINKASAVMLVEEKILPLPLGRQIAKGVQHAIDQASTPQGKRPSDVLQIEKIITDAVGPDASLIHAGRSRQDMYATFRTAKVRNQLLDYADALLALRARTLKVAAAHVNTYVPAYTNGVQAQPISYAHYLLAFDASFVRDAQRLREAYARINRSAMGTAVLANSSWPLNRPRLAELLGFDGLLENSLDAGQIAAIDLPMEAVSIASSGALRIGTWLGDIHTQYHQVRPWLLLGEGSTYTSSAMPQKRNPGLLMRARERASNVVGLAQAVALRAHNVSSGMTDSKESVAELGALAQAVRMVEAMNAVLDALSINPARALEELEDEWTTSMELAEALAQEHQIPFRVGHRFASEIVTFARDQGLKPKNFPYEKAQEFYAKAIAHFKLPDPKLPLSSSRFREVLSPAFMVKTRVGVGGPQPAEVDRMLKQAQAQLSQDRVWLDQRRQNLRAADLRLNEAFMKLLNAS